MTDALATILDAMVPPQERAAGEWERVLRDAERRARRPVRRRRLAIGGALAFALLLITPLAVVGSSRDWWFFAHGGPKPATPVAVLESGSWSGQQWTLTAFRNRRGNICFSVNAGQASALGCTTTTGHAFLGLLQVIPQRKSLRWFAAVTKQSVDRLAVTFSNGDVLRTTALTGPASLGFDGHFFVIRQPDDPSITIERVGGYARDGRLIACVDQTTHRVNAPTAVCAE